jgi:hypothetical protein
MSQRDARLPTALLETGHRSRGPCRQASELWPQFILRPLRGDLLNLCPLRQIEFVPSLRGNRTYTQGRSISLL